METQVLNEMNVLDLRSKASSLCITNPKQYRKDQLIIEIEKKQSKSKPESKEEKDKRTLDFMKDDNMSSKIEDFTDKKNPYNLINSINGSKTTPKKEIKEENSSPKEDFEKKIEKDIRDKSLLLKDDKVKFITFKDKIEMKGVVKSVFFDKQSGKDYVYIQGEDGKMYCKLPKSVIKI